MVYGIKPDYMNSGIYHLYNRGVAKQKIFSCTEDYARFLITLAFYLEKSPDRRLSLTSSENRAIIMATEPINPLVEILAYSLMPNHFHLVVRQTVENGIVTFMRRSLNSYTRAYNARHKRVGPIFQGVYQSITCESDAQLMQLTRYVHLNPYISRLVEEPSEYKWSSLPNYVKNFSNRICHTQFLTEISGSRDQYRDFVYDYSSYSRDLASIKDLLIDENDT